MRKPEKNEKITLMSKKNEDSLPDTQITGQTKVNDNQDQELEGHVETDDDESGGEGDTITDDNHDNPLLVTETNKIKENKPVSDHPVHNEEKHLEQSKELCEINVDISGNTDAVQLKTPIVVYREIYKKAKEKAKHARLLAIQAFLEANKIRNTFLAGEVEESDDDLEYFIELPKE